MFDKKLGYKYENQNNTAYIVIRLVLYIGFLIYIYLYNDKIDMYIKHLFTTLVGVLILIQFYSHWKDQKKDEEIEKLKDEGYIVTGKIDKIITKIKGRGLNKKYRYFIYISYIDPQTNEKKDHLTKELNFNPLIELGSTTCTIYTRDDRIYVTDFIKRRRNDPCAWPELQQEMEKAIRKRIIKFIIFIVLIIFIIIPLIVKAI